MELLVAVAVFLVLLSGLARAQDGFRVTFNVERSGADQMQVTGTVFNDSRAEVLDVSVTAEALDAKGKVLARGITYVSSRIPGQGSAPFVAKVPAVSGAARYRASVSSFRAGFGSQAP